MDRVKISNSDVDLEEMKKRIPRITIERIEESFPELWDQGFVKFENTENHKKKEQNFNETVGRSLPGKESVVALEMWNMALKENQDRKYTEPHICPFCNKCIQSRWSLRRHIRTHSLKQASQTSTKVVNGHKQKSSQRWCSICGKGFFNALALRNHIAMHNLQCKLCKKQFTKLEDLDLHSNSHFRCNTCGNVFISQKRLEQHSIIHSSIKSFSCKICDMQFTSEQSLSIHQKRHEVKSCQTNVVPQNNSKWMVIIHSWPSTDS